MPPYAARIIRAFAIASLLAVTGSAVALCQSVAGSIEDSLFGRGPLPDATIWIQDTATRIQTDQAGRFRIDGVPVGTYSLSFSHPAFDSAGISPPRWRVTVPPHGLNALALVTPSPQTAFGSVCAGWVTPDVGYVVGRVRDAVADTGLAGVRVTANWLAPTQPGSQAPTVLVRNQTRTGENGAFVLCPVPKHGMIAVQAAADSMSTGLVTHSLDGQPLAVVTLALATRPAAQNAGAEIRMPTARLRGTVRTPDGQPAAGARVTVDDAALATTDASGAFGFADLPLGTRVIAVSAIGRERVTRVVDLRPGENGHIDLEVGRPLQRLPSVEVVAADASVNSMSAIEDRVRRAGGHLITAKDIQKRRPRKFEDVLRGIPGLTIEPAPDGGDNYFVPADRAYSSRGQRNFQAQQCSPSYFVDGAYVEVAMDQTPFPVPVDEIRAIEIYTAANAPVQYHRERSLCGAIAVWTKNRVEEGTR